LQILPGLAPLVREGDQVQAYITLRNATEQAMKVSLESRIAGIRALPSSTRACATRSSSTRPARPSSRSPASSASSDALSPRAVPSSPGAALRVSDVAQRWRRSGR
jgi:hypothetical protein